MKFETADILDLAPADLDPLLRAEANAWQTELHWDYSATLRLIYQWLEERRLTGCAIRANGQMKGFCFYFTEGPRAVIADLFVEPGAEALAYARGLLDRALHQLLSSPQIERVEAQLPHLAFDRLNTWFGSRAFAGYGREFMVRPLCGPEAEVARMTGSTEGDFWIEPWERRYDREATELLYHAYRHHVDAAINEQYASFEGISRLMENVIYHHGCGEFLSGASLVAVHRLTQKLAGILGATRVRRNTAHLPQVAVAAEFQRAGVGTTLLGSGLKMLQQLGFEEVSLTVTSLNQGAVRLYQRFGFRTFRTFGAFVWQRVPANPQRFLP